MPKIICIIGAGASGLTAIKACKEEGLEPVCYEWTRHVGGLWRYRDDDVHGLASVMRSTIINSSKEMSAFSDFPPPDEYPNYMHNSKMIRYLELYAESFDLLPYVRFGCRVKHVERAEDYEETGRWTVTVQRIGEEEPFRQSFDGVMVCAGHHVFPIIPKFPGQEEFLGTVTHTHSYKKPNGYEDKRVLVVGVGNSGGDVAVELSSIASQVYLSSRRGCWVIHRVGPKGYPLDISYMRRSWNLLFTYLPLSLVCGVVERQISQRFDHELYRLKPKHRIFGQHPMVNDALPNRIISGTVQLKGDIRRFTSKNVIFEDGEVVPIDCVILATGYKIHFPYLSTDDVPVWENNQVELYKFAFPPKHRHNTLVLIGLGQPVGALFPISELQSRLFALVMTGKIQLPSCTEMLADIRRKEACMKVRYFDGPRHTIQMDWINYMDELACLARVKPNFIKMFFKDPCLWMTCIFGPCLPYQYRLEGHHSWSGARNAILTYEERVKEAFNSRKITSSRLGTKEQANVLYLKISLGVLLMAVLLFFILG